MAIVYEHCKNIILTENNKAKIKLFKMFKIAIKLYFEFYRSHEQWILIVS